MSVHQLRLGWHAFVGKWRRVAESDRRRAAGKARKKSAHYRAEQLESRAMLSVVNLVGTSGNDVISFVQTDATHDTFTLNGTPNTFSTVGVTAITINSGAGTDSITIASDNSAIPLSVTGDGNDTFILSATQGTGTTITGHGSGNTLVGPNATNSWNITSANAGTLNGASFSTIQNLTGGTGDDTFAFSPIGVVNGTIDGGGGSVDTLDYSGRTAGIVVNLQTSSATAIGGGFSNISSLVGSNSLFNTLTGTNTANNWNIAAVDSGTVNGTAFSGFQTLIGGTGNDSFAFTSAGSVTKQVSGGGGAGVDTLDYSALSTSIVVDLKNGVASNVGGVSGVRNVVSSTGNSIITAHDLGSVITASGAGSDTLIGGSGNDTFILSALQGAGTTITAYGGTNTLVGSNSTNTWNITSGNTGTLNGVSFSYIQNLTGGSGNDSFAFSPNGFVSGTVNGGGGSVDTIDYSGRTVGVVVNLQASSATAIGGGFSNITSLIGSNSLFNTLTGANTANNWNITAVDSGTVNGIAFSGFQTLLGGTGNDSFAFASGGSVTKQVSGGGGAGVDTLDYSALSTSIIVNLKIGVASNVGGVSGVHNVVSSTGNSTITAHDLGSVITASGAGSDTLYGGPGNDTFILSAGQGAGTTTTGYGGTNSIIGPNTASSWTITGTNSGSLNGASFSNIQNLTGGTAVDHFYMFEGGSIAGTLNGGSTSGDWLDYSNWNVDKSYVNLANGSATSIGGGAAGELTNIQNVRAAWYGGMLTGNSQGNILIGGPYSGTPIVGGSGRSLLLTNDPVNGVPGQGPAALTGGSGNDIIIGKDTTYDDSNLTNDAALASILAEWQSSNSYTDRIAHIKGTTTGGLNGTNYLIFGTTVIQSPGTVTMAGAAGGMNWYFVGVHDEVFNLQPGEQVN